MRKGHAPFALTGHAARRFTSSAGLVAVFALILSGLGGCGGNGGSGGPVGGGGAPLSSNADLADLVISAGPLFPPFSPDQTDYFVGPGFIENIAAVTATAADPGATLELSLIGLTGTQPMTSGVATFSFLGFGVAVVVTAEDGAMTKSYEIQIVAGPPAGLRGYAKASNADALDGFGGTLAASGDTIVVGAPNEASNATGINGNQGDNSAPESGAVYVFVRFGSTWVQEAYLKASNTGANDEFGASVAIDGDTIVVGAPAEDSNATGVNGDGSNDLAMTSGAAYVFVRSGSTWTQQAYLKASNTDPGDFFGVSVGISGDTIVVSAPGEDSISGIVNSGEADNSAMSSGAAYVFVRNGATWTQEAYLKAPNADALDSFGTSIGVSGDLVVVGAPGESSAATGVNGNLGDNSEPNAGAAFVFERMATQWMAAAYLKPSDTDPGDGFGLSVSVRSVSGSQIMVGTLLDFSIDIVAVGAPFEDSDATGVGGDDTNNLAMDSGAAYVFQRFRVGPIGDFEFEDYLKASNTETSDRFGGSVQALHGVVAVGAIQEDSDGGGIDGRQGNNNAMNSGAVYVFTQGILGSSWQQESYVKPSNTRPMFFFGAGLAIADGALFVGAPGEDGGTTGIGGNQSVAGVPSSGALYGFY